MRSHGGALFCLLLAGCVPGELDLQGRACPCAAGWTCDEVRDVCVEGALADAGPRDAGHDAGHEGDAGQDGGPDAALPSDAGSDGGSDAGPDSTACDDVHAGAIFCDGFESSDLSAWDSTYADAGSSSTRSTSQSHRGLGSLHTQVAAGGGEATARSLASASITTGELYLRAYYYLPGSVALVSGISLMQIGHDDAPWEHVGVSVDAPSTSSMYVTTDGTPSEWRPGAVVPRDEWFCVELHVSASDADGMAEYWLNGVRQGEATAIDSVPARGFERFVVGIPYSPSEEGATEVYVDEVVYDDERIGCD